MFLTPETKGGNRRCISGQTETDSIKAIPAVSLNGTSAGKFLV